MPWWGWLLLWLALSALVAVTLSRALAPPDEDPPDG